MCEPILSRFAKVIHVCAPLSLVDEQPIISLLTGRISERSFRRSADRSGRNLDRSPLHSRDFRSEAPSAGFPLARVVIDRHVLSVDISARVYVHTTGETVDVVRPRCTFICVSKKITEIFSLPFPWRVGHSGESGLSFFMRAIFQTLSDLGYNTIE